MDSYLTILLLFFNLSGKRIMYRTSLKRVKWRMRRSVAGDFRVRLVQRQGRTLPEFVEVWLLQLLLLLLLLRWHFVLRCFPGRSPCFWLCLVSLRVKIKTFTLLKLLIAAAN